MFHVVVWALLIHPLIIVSRNVDDALPRSLGVNRDPESFPVMLDTFFTHTVFVHLDESVTHVGTDVEVKASPSFTGSALS